MEKFDRYSQKISELLAHFSEYTLDKYRIFVEIKYLQALTKKEKGVLNRIFEKFNETDFARIKEIEKKTNHDVKAVEYFLQEKLTKLKIKNISSFVHLGITSDDTNNLAYSLILKNFKNEHLALLLAELIDMLKNLSKKTKNVAILARTHGQPAVPTTFGKEMANYVYRLGKQELRLKNFNFEGKLNGAVGNYNALQFVYPKIDWTAFSKQFIKSLGLTPNLFTTQILFYDNFVEFFQIVELINNIVLDLSINIWIYIMLGILKQKPKATEVGSSTMPQKVNPIDFERAEANTQLANSYFQFYSRKLMSSRLQRDLSDSTIRRTFGSAFGYTVLGWKNIIDGFSKIEIDKLKAEEELNSHWEILSEAVQVYLRAKGDILGYEKLKKITRGKTITEDDFKLILKKLDLDKKKEFINLTPEKYTGLAEKLTGLL